MNYFVLQLLIGLKVIESNETMNFFIYNIGNIVGCTLLNTHHNDLFVFISN